MTTQELQDTIALLSRTPAALNALLRDLPESWTMRNEGGKTFAPFGIVGHLLEAERSNWVPRAKHLLQFGESQPFASFDRTGHERDTQGKSLSELLDRFAQARKENLDQLRSMNLTETDLQKRGMHPSLGPVTLSQLLSTWATHDLTHLHQLSRVLAYQNRERVGPFTKFLGVLKCEGHSD